MNQVQVLLLINAQLV